MRIVKRDIMMTDGQHYLDALALLRQQTWLSPAFPTGSYSYSHGIEWAVEAGHIRDRDGSGCAENARKATFHFYEFEERRRCGSNRKLCHREGRIRGEGKNEQK